MHAPSACLIVLAAMGTQLPVVLERRSCDKQPIQGSPHIRSVCDGDCSAQEQRNGSALIVADKWESARWQRLARRRSIQLGSHEGSAGTVFAHRNPCLA